MPKSSLKLEASARQHVFNEPASITRDHNATDGGPLENIKMQNEGSSPNTILVAPVKADIIKRAD